MDKIQNLSSSDFTSKIMLSKTYITDIHAHPAIITGNMEGII